ncbi:MAG: MerR family transcriptional regulator [Bdellovibrionales bacterium]|nr:MerR family transcriptional regulator [Bdellovibrionales bacterium]
MNSPIIAPSSTEVKSVPVDAELQKDLTTIPDKMAFKIGEVADLVGVKSHVLRYWETEFSGLSPKKSPQGQRMYARKDVETLLMIKKLLYRDRYSIEGARGALKKMRKQGVKVHDVAEASDAVEDMIQRASDVLDRIHRLKALLNQF